MSDDYHDAIRLAVRYLLAKARPVPVQFSTTFNRGFTKPFYPTPLDQARNWHSGVFFAASNWALAQWRSEAYTTAIVLEALSKYAIGYELSSGSLRTGARLHVLSYARNADTAPGEMRLSAPAN